MCPGNNGPLCVTCRLGGLIRCPIMGVPLPLVDGERTKVEHKRVQSWPNPADQEAINRWRRDQGHFE